MDIVDRAQEREAEFQAQALAAAIHRPREAPHTVDGVRVCRDCEDPLGRQRLKANPDAVRCMDCQKWYERQQRNGRGHA